MTAEELLFRFLQYPIASLDEDEMGSGVPVASAQTVRPPKTVLLCQNMVGRLDASTYPAPPFDRSHRRFDRSVMEAF